jgi:hypothetical protein
LADQEGQEDACRNSDQTKQEDQSQRAESCLVHKGSNAFPAFVAEADTQGDPGMLGQYTQIHGKADVLEECCFGVMVFEFDNLLRMDRKKAEPRSRIASRLAMRSLNDFNPGLMVSPPLFFVPCRGYYSMKRLCLTLS